MYDSSDKSEEVNYVIADFFSKCHENGYKRTYVQHNCQEIVSLTAAENVLPQRQMSAARNRQKLCKSLYDSLEYCV